MRAPTIHLNGTSGDTLRDQYLDAAAALDRAIEVMQDAAPNARDYYPQGADAFREALLEHSERLVLIRRVMNDLDLLAEQVQNQIDQRPGRA